MKKLILVVMLLSSYAHAETGFLFYTSSANVIGDLWGTGSITMDKVIVSSFTQTPMLCLNGACADSWAGASGDNLGNHTATTILQMGNYEINSSSSINAKYYQINGSTVLSTLGGVGNIAVGIGAGRINTGGMNTFVGHWSGYLNSTGDYNTFIGHKAGFYNNAGANNTSVGYLSGESNAAGTDNTIIGFGAAYMNSNSGNSILGSEAGNGGGVIAATSFADSVFVGYRSGYNATTGSNNTFIGYKSGDSVTTGNNNIIIGYDIDASAAGASNELNVGGILKGDISVGSVWIPGNAFSIGTSTLVVNAGKVGVGVSPTNGKLDVYNTTIGAAVYANSAKTSGNSASIVGYTNGASADLNIGGEFGAVQGTVNEAIHIDANSPSSGSENYAIRSLSNAKSYFTGNIITASTLTVDGNAFSVGGSTLVVSGGKVGIGTVSPTQKLHVYGNVKSDNGTISTLLSQDGVYGYGANDMYVQAPTSYDLLLNSSGGNVGIGTVSPTATLDVNGFSKLGSASTAMSMVYISSNTAYSEGSYTLWPHGLTVSKIISAACSVWPSTTFAVHPAEFAAGYKFSYRVNSSWIEIDLDATSSENILNVPFKCLIWYTN